MASTHSALSPSSAERWIACPGSIQLTAGLPKPPSSPAAAQGTACHTLAEALVTGTTTEKELRKRVGVKMRTWDGFEVPITTEMVDGALLYHETIKALTAEFKGNGIIAKPEVKVTATTIDQEVKGTADYVIYQIGRRLVVVDFKFGKKAVNPTENKQLGIYLVGAMDSLAKSDSFDELELIVVQPRAGGKPVRRWVVPKVWVDQFRADMRRAVAETRRHNARLSAGNWCFFCAAKGAKRKDGSLVCPEIAKEVQSQIKADFSVIPAEGKANLPAPNSLAGDKIAKILSWESVIVSWLKDLHDRAKEMREMGLDVPGYKLVESRTHRKWAKSPEEVAENLSLYVDEKELYEPQYLKSVAQVEELLGGKKAAVLEKMGLVTKPDGDSIIVPLDDPRPELKGNADLDFTPVAGGDNMDELLELLGDNPVTPKVTRVEDDPLADLIGPWKEAVIVEDPLADLMGEPEKKVKRLWP